MQGGAGAPGPVGAAVNFFFLHLQFCLFVCMFVILTIEFVRKRYVVFIGPIQMADLMYNNFGFMISSPRA